MPHETVNHNEGEYVRGNVHTANLDSFWSLLKRGIMGTFHKVSASHLPLYLNEFSWRHNHRKNRISLGASSQDAEDGAAKPSRRRTSSDSSRPKS